MRSKNWDGLSLVEKRFLMVGWDNMHEWGRVPKTQVTPRSEREEYFIDQWDNRRGFRHKVLDDMSYYLGDESGPHNDYDYFLRRGWQQLDDEDRLVLLNAFKKVDNEKKNKEQKSPAKIPKISREPSPIEKTMMAGQVQASSPLGGGVNETEILEIEGGVKGVFKGVNGEAPYMRHSMEAGTYYLREAAAYEACRFLGWDYCPETVVREHNGEIGSFMKFAEGADCGSYHNISECSEEDIENMAFYNIVIGNIDRHGKNWMYKDGKPVAIDHGLAFHDSRTYGHSLRSKFLSHLDGEEISARIKEKAENVLLKKQELSNILSEFINPSELESIFDRVHIIANRDHYDYWGDFGGWD
jgi:hypothetical protein